MKLKTKWQAHYESYFILQTMEVVPGTGLTDYGYAYPISNNSLRFIEVRIVIKETKNVFINFDYH